MGEALVALDRIADGIQHLNPELVTDVATTLPVKPDTGGCFISSKKYFLVGTVFNCKKK